MYDGEGNWFLIVSKTFPGWDHKADIFNQILYKRRFGVQNTLP